MLQEVPSLPTKLHEIRDAVIAAHHGGLEIPATVRFIQEWLEGDGWEAMQEAWDDEIVIDLGAVSRFYLDDCSLREKQELEENATISNTQRLQYSRELIDSLATDLSETLTPAVHTYALQDDDDRGVVICAKGTWRGEDGVDLDWLGIWDDKESFLFDLHSIGLLRLTNMPGILGVDEIGQLTDEEILGLWKNK